MRLPLILRRFRLVRHCPSNQSLTALPAGERRGGCTDSLASWRLTRATTHNSTAGHWTPLLCTAPGLCHLHLIGAAWLAIGTHHRWLKRDSFEIARLSALLKFLSKLDSKTYQCLGSQHIGLSWCWGATNTRYLHTLDIWISNL